MLTLFLIIITFLSYLLYILLLYFLNLEQHSVQRFLKKLKTVCTAKETTTVNASYSWLIQTVVMIAPILTSMKRPH